MRIENQISSEIKSLNLDLPWVNMPEMSLPADYFESFTHHLTEEIANRDFWDNMPKNMPQEVPSSFFNESEDEISTAAFLSQLPKSVAGEIPKDYFVQFENQLSTSIFIDQLPKANPQTIPVGYFDQFHANLMKHESIKPAVPHGLKVTSRRFNPMAMAASILFLLGIGFLFFNQSKPVGVEQQVATLSASEIENYIQEHQVEFDADITTDYIDPNNVDIQKLEEEIYNNNLNQLSQDDIEAYLL